MTITLGPKRVGPQGRTNVGLEALNFSSDVWLILKCVYHRISAASNVPRREYKPRSIKRSPSELNGVSTTSSAKTTGELTILWVLHALMQGCAESACSLLIAVFCVVTLRFWISLLGYLVNSLYPLGMHPFLLSCIEYLYQGQIPPYSVKFSHSVMSDSMNHSTSGLPVHHQLLESNQTHVHWVGDAIQPSHPLLSPSPPAPNPSQHQGLFQWVNSLHEVAKVLEFQLQHQSFQWTPRTDLL